MFVIDPFKLGHLVFATGWTCSLVAVLATRFLVALYARLGAVYFRDKACIVRGDSLCDYTPRARAGTRKTGKLTFTDEG